jgi:hypothetical protein
MNDTAENDIPVKGAFLLTLIAVPSSHVKDDLSTIWVSGLLGAGELTSTVGCSGATWTQSASFGVEDFLSRYRE